MLDVLVAYPYMSKGAIKKLREIKKDVRFMLDSGAFTAWKAKAVIHLDDYCSFLETLDAPVWRYFVLDVVGDPKATRKNYNEMRRRGFNPIPIFTRGENPKALDDYYETTDFVAIGGLGGTNEGLRPQSYLKGIWPHVRSRKVHILGFTNMEWLKIFRPTTCDSSSWLAARRFGYAYLYMGHGRMKLIPRWDIQNRAHPHIVERAARYGVDLFALNEKNADTSWKGMHGLAQKLTTRSWVECQADVGANLNTGLFLAGANAQDVSELHEAYLLMKEMPDVRRKFAAKARSNKGWAV